MRVVTRRDLLGGAATVVGGWAVFACAPPSEGTSDAAKPPRDEDGEVQAAPTCVDAVDAVFDVLVPTERDGAGKVIEVGARDCGANRLLDDEGFALVALAQGLVPRVSDRVLALLAQGGAAFRLAANAQLDTLAQARRPLVAFRDLPRALQEDVVAAAFDDRMHEPLLQVLRAMAFTAYVGAVTSDAGLRALGYPAFEDWNGRIAVSGYPRTKAGRLIDATSENLGQLAANGDLDDYTYNRAPAATPGDDISALLDANGDMI